MNPFLVEQMAMYQSYHQDVRNRAAHFIGIPAIVFSIFIPLSWVTLFQLGGYGVSLAVIVYIASTIYYLWLDLAMGLAMAVAVLPLLLLGQACAELGSVAAWTIFAIAFVGGWVFQLVGHVFEGRRPALTDNLLQALIGPLFLMAETFIALGLKRDLHQAVQARWRAYADPARRTAGAH